MRKEESQISKKREKTLSSKEVYKGKILDVFLDEVELPSGRISHREVIRHCHAAAVLAFNDKNEVILEDQYRYPYDDIITEIPAGKGDEGETGEETARRELEEETGYRADTLEELGLFYPSVGYTDEAIHLYLAKDLVKTHQHLDEGEELEYYFVPFEKLCDMIRNGEIADGKTVAAVGYYLLKYQK